MVENDIPDINSISSSLDFDFNINVNELFKSELSEEDIKLLDEINALNLKPNYSKEEIEDYIKTLEEYNRNEEIKRIENEMKKAAQELDFERATELRDILFEMKGNLDEL